MRERPTLDLAQSVTLGESKPGKRGGKPCIRGLRITVYDVLESFASAISGQDILRDFPFLIEQDIRVYPTLAADRERKSEIFDA